MAEKEVLNMIIEYLQGRGLYVIRTNAGTVQDVRSGSWIKGQERGHPDLVCEYLNKHFGFIECKASENCKLSPDQVSFMREQDRAGRPWAVCCSFEDVERWLADPGTHGNAKLAAPVLDSTVFSFSERPKRKSSKLTASQWLDWERFNSKSDK